MVGISIGIFGIIVAILGHSMEPKTEAYASFMITSLVMGGLGVAANIFEHWGHRPR